MAAEADIKWPQAPPGHQRTPRWLFVPVLQRAQVTVLLMADCTSALWHPDASPAAMDASGGGGGEAGEDVAETRDDASSRWTEPSRDLKGPSSEFIERMKAHIGKWKANMDTHLATAADRVSAAAVELGEDLRLYEALQHP